MQEKYEKVSSKILMITELIIEDMEEETYRIKFFKKRKWTFDKV